MSTILFDFFGTLVDYDPSRTTQGYERSHAVLADAGCTLPYDAWLHEWDATAARFEAACDDDDHEFSMHEVGLEFLTTALDRRPGPDELDAFIDAYLAEWNAGVRPIDGVPALLTALAADHRLAVVTNTHHPSLVPGHLAAMGVDHLMDAVVTSVEVGWRKPHPAIYRAALDALQVEADDCTFVGDTHGPDYTGPRALGMQALLIDPEHRHEIDPSHRIASVLDLSDRPLG